ncbi:HAD-IIIC family phosphatase [Streptomyces sp. NPDC017979]|uniref:HAD-IIIC family phosphatase n=1 Tax=Streptomyces sp. NPDC017979 TaxID=3365024 RepID=UPI00378CD1A6
MIPDDAVVKCVVWDLDDTLWDGIALESPDDTLPTPRPEVLALIDGLAARGVLSSVASRSGPSVLERLRADGELSGRFFAPQVAWHDKSESLRRIAGELGIGLASLVLVDDSPYERAEVRAALPEVLALAPEEAPGLLALPALDPAGLTDESRGRVARYRDEARRKEAEETFAGSREDFLRWCGMRVRLRTAHHADVPRIVELAARTHRLNSSGIELDAAAVRSMVDSPDWSLPVVELTDRFGTYGMVGTAVVALPDPELGAGGAWDVRLLTLSCRVAGRGVSAAFLRWLLELAGAAGAPTVRTPVRIGADNMELRLLLRQFGFRAEQDGAAAPLVTFARATDGPLPEAPAWIECEYGAAS